MRHNNIKSRATKASRAAGKSQKAARPGGVEVYDSSGNVFADLELPDAGDMLIKAKLAGEICRLIRLRSWTQAEAARRLGVDQPKVSALMRGRLHGFALERLMRFCKALDREVAIVVRSRAGRALGDVQVLIEA